MDVNQIERVMAAMAANDITEFHLEQEGQSLRLARAAGIRVAGEALPAVYAAPADGEPKSAEKQAPLGGREVVSPMVGVFHPVSGREIKVGSKLKKGEVLCVVEAMKLMNDIVMEEDGEIIFLALSDGDMVEYGQIIAQYNPI